jgi:hypothetical protein
MYEDFVELTELINDEFLKITYFDKESDDIFLAFSSTPRLAQGEEVAIEQFIGTLSNNKKAAIFIIDKQSSYGNKIDMKKIADLISPIIAGRNTHSIGYCMGGFLAIDMSNYISIDSVVAMTPQWSIHPDILPKNSYLNIFTNNIDSWKIKDLSQSFNSQTRYFIFNSHDGDDQYQIGFFPERPNLKIFEFGVAFGHDLPEALNDGTLESLMLNCVYGDSHLVSDFISSYYE